MEENILIQNQVAKLSYNNAGDHAKSTGQLKRGVDLHAAKENSYKREFDQFLIRQKKKKARNFDVNDLFKWDSKQDPAGKAGEAQPGGKQFPQWNQK